MRMLFCFLLYSSTASAQSLFFPKDSSVVSTVDLPSRQPFDTAKSYNKISGPYYYIISIKDMYNLFTYETHVKYYQFNFADYHILGELKCRQCMMVCRHDEGETNCHRNACDREWIWVKRENKKAFTEVSSYTIPWYEKKSIIQGDTIITTSSDTSRWHTTGHGDCFAKFKYGLFFDKHNSVLILKEWNYWGGCRAGGSKPSTIVYKEPEGILYKTKRTILMEKDYKDL